MKLRDALRGITLLGVDSVALIYLVEKKPDYLDRMIFIARHITHGPISAVSAALALTEVLVHPLRTKNDVLVREYEDILQNSMGFELVALTPAIARKAAQLRAEHNLKTPDAIHIATAIDAGCQAFLTNDTSFRRVDEIAVLVLDELELDLPDET